LAKTVSMVRQSVFGNMRVRIADVDVTSYTDGGEPLTAAELGMNATLESVVPVSYEKYYLFWYDFANAKLKIGDPTTGAEVAATTDGGVVRILAIGQ